MHSPRRALLAGLIVGVVTLAPGPSPAAPGDPDLDWAGTGSVATVIPGATRSIASAVVRLSNGRILTAGTTGSPASAEVALVRYLDDGTPDATFGPGGIVLPLPGLAVEAGAVSLVRADDGGLVLAATLVGSADHDVLVARLTAAGTLDPGFGVAGLRIVDVGADDRAAALALDHWQRPVVVGRAAGQVLVVRLTAAGDLDPELDGDGVLLTDASGAGLPSAAHDVAVQPNDSLVVAGEASNGDDLDLAVLSYDEHGVLDPGFGTGGIVTTPVSEGFPGGPPPNDAARAVVIEPGGSIVVAGTTRSNVHLVVVARYDAAGSLDPGFGSGGIVVTARLAEGGQGYDLVREPNGRLVVAGLVFSSEALGVTAGLLVRLETNGALDSGFGDGGLVVYGPPGSLVPHEAANAVLRDSLGRFVVAGYTDLTFFPWNATNFAVSRFLGDGPCNGGPDPGCLRSVVPHRSLLRVLDPVSGRRRLAWRLPGVEATALGDFGDPLAEDDYQLCVLDGTGARVIQGIMPAGGTCGRRDCWRERPKGFDYADPEKTPDGIARVRLRAGPDGKALVQVDAMGESLLLPPLPLTTPLTVQLHTTSGVCWEGTYRFGSVRRNDDTTFVARGTP